MRPYFITIHPTESNNSITLIIEQFRDKRVFTISGSANYEDLKLDERFAEFVKKAK